MEFTIKMARLRGRTLPLNYQYALSSWIYKVIAEEDRPYASWLHKEGHAIGHKKFKLFTFSRLIIHPYKIKGDRILIMGDEIALNVRFLVHRSMEKFIRGLFMQQRFTLGDWKSQVKLQVQEMTLQTGPLFTATMRYESVSPVCMAVNGDKYASYLSPHTVGYGEYLFRNLCKKQMANSMDGATDNFNSFSFKLLSKPLSRLITMKPGTSDAVQVRGYSFNFEMTLPPALHQIGYYAGFGEKNSTGFGCVKAISQNSD